MTSGRALVVMGVAGTGKTTVGRAVAERLGWAFIEGDELHPPANIERMRSGQPLTDEDRGPWIDAIVARMAELGRSVVACSALRRAHRERLRSAVGEVRFAWLDGADEVILARLEQRAARGGHFMGAGMLGSQLEALERPAGEAGVARLDVAGPVDGLVAEAAALMGG